MIPEYQLLAQRIRNEVDELERNAHRAAYVWQGAQKAPVDRDVYIESVALNLHGFYAGLERLFEAVAQVVDGGLPKGESWHRDLLQQMAYDVPSLRPPVVSSETASGLDEFRRFRHVVRNVYAEHLDPNRIGNLVAKLSPLWPQVKAELLAFAQFLEGVSKADDEMAE
jgi:hypothetical protein